MRPLVLKGGSQPVVDVKYNVDGDLLFTASKEKVAGISVWWSDTGERIGTYDGHTGAIYAIDVNHSSTRLISGAGDNTARLWDVETGRELCVFHHDANTNNYVRHVAFATGAQRFLTLAEPTQSSFSQIRIFKVTDDWRDQRSHVGSDSIPGPSKTDRFQVALWGWQNKTIITGHNDGFIRLYDVEKKKIVHEVEAHKKTVTSLQFEKYGGVFVSASKDGTAKLIDAQTLQIIKTYEAGRPLNAAAISPLMDHVIVGGGERAEEVTQTELTVSQFKVRFFHSIFCTELGSILGHFGPVNALAFSPDGKQFTSGGQDGFVRVHPFGDDYLNRTDEITKYE